MHEIFRATGARQNMRRKGEFRNRVYCVELDKKISEE